MTKTGTRHRKEKKQTQNQETDVKVETDLRQDPLEAILVIFGRRALIFFLFESSWKNMKNDTTFVRMRSGDHLGDAKKSKRAPRSVKFNFLLVAIDKRFSQNERRRADLQNFASDLLIFAKGLSYDLSNFSDDFTPFFWFWKTINKSLGKN